MADFQSRTSERRRCLLKVQLVFNGGRSKLEATIRNISAAGALVEAQDLRALPDEFDFVILNPPHESETRRARRAWQHEGAMGVAFLEGAGHARGQADRVNRVA